MAITSVPSLSNTQVNQTSIGQSGADFQAASVTNSNTASQYIDAPIYAGYDEPVYSAPTASNTQLNLTNIHQLGGHEKSGDPGFQFADVTNDNTADQDIFAGVSVSSPSVEKL